jgi:hypothetical protein
MFTQLFIGSVIIVTTVLVTAGFVATAAIALTSIERWISRPPFPLKNIVSLVGVTLWLLTALTIAVWIWALAFLELDLFNDLEQAVYFAIVSFTTLGFGDVILEKPWRLLSGLCAANGLLLFSLSAAFLFEFFYRVGKAQE